MYASVGIYGSSECTGTPSATLLYEVGVCIPTITGSYKFTGASGALNWAIYSDAACADQSTNTTYNQDCTLVYKVTGPAAFALPADNYGTSWYLGADCTGDIVGAALVSTAGVAGFDCAAAAKAYGCVKDTPATGLSQSYSCAGGAGAGNSASTVSAAGAAAAVVLGALLL
jgi:hypothetical protein